MSVIPEINGTLGPTVTLSYLSMNVRDIQIVTGAIKYSGSIYIGCRM